MHVIHATSSLPEPLQVFCSRSNVCPSVLAGFYNLLNGDRNIFLIHRLAVTFLHYQALAVHSWPSHPLLRVEQFPYYCFSPDWIGHPSAVYYILSSVSNYVAVEHGFYHFACSFAIGTNYRVLAFYPFHLHSLYMYLLRILLILPAYLQRRSTLLSVYPFPPIDIDLLCSQ
jgi:hypothetical protein